MKNNRLKIALILGLSLLWLMLPQSAAWGQGINRLNINTVGDGTVEKDPSQTYYDDGEIVELHAQAGGGFIFSHWSGDLTGGTNPTEITMDGEKTVTAHFEDSGIYTLSIMFNHDDETEPPHGSVFVEPHSQQYGDEHEEMYDYPAGTEVTLTGEGRFMDYYLWYWSGDIYSHDNPVIITMDSDMRITPMWMAEQPVICRLGVTDGKFLIEIQGIPDWGDAGLMSYGTTVEIKANNPPEDHHFTHWSGPTEDDTKNISDIYASSTSITMYNDADIFANFEPNSEGDYYSLSIAAVHGTVIRDPQKAEYEAGEEVGLTARPNAGYDFLHWEGDLTGSENPTTITMDSHKSIRAVFDSPQYTLDIIASNGTVIKDPDKERYHEDERIDLEADPDLGYIFAEWQGDLTGTDNPAFIIMTGEPFEKTVTAIFEESEYAYTLEVIAEYGRVIIIPEKDGYDENERVDLIAQGHPDYPDYDFIRWEGDITGSSNPVHIMMEGEKTQKIVTAVFESSGALLDFTLNITAVNGHVTKIPDAERYESATPVTLLATPNAGYRFSGWSGDLSGMQNPTTIIMDSHKDITANFSSDDVVLGDVTGNGEITSYDASLAAQYSIRLIDMEPDQIQAADVTGNGEVSSYDASLIAQYAIGLIDGF